MTKLTSLQRLMNNGVQNYPDKPAITFESKTYSYRQLHQLSRKLASGLQANGVVTSDRVAIFLPNCPEAVIVFFACYMIGAIVVPLNYRYQADEARYVIEKTMAKLILFHAEQREIIDLLQDLFTQETMFLLSATTEADSQYSDIQSLFAGTELAEFSPITEQHPAFILYTSGTTGKPKGVTHSHQGAFSGIEISRQALDFTQQDIVLVGKPISHAGGLQTQLMPALLVGARVILSMRPSPADAVALIKQYSVSEYGLLASDLLDFIEYLEEHSPALPSLNNSVGSGDAVPIDLHHRFKKLFGWEVLEGCGMTEVGCYYSMNPRYGLHKFGSMGKPCPLTQIRIVNDQGEQLPQGETGEIELKTPSATIGYWQDAASNQQLFRDNWLLTGDLAHFDEQGYLWFVGRKKLMIVRRGSNVSPIEVENILDEHAAVHASVVVGMPDSHDGQVPVACIALLHDTLQPSTEELNIYLSTRLAAYKIPKHYLILSKLPRNATGKFDRHQLEQIVLTKFAS